VRDLILSHLIPPCPPLPPQALSRTFIDRLTFLPPDEDDLDAHLTPFAMAKNALNPHALHYALSQLSGGLKVNDTEYAHDGEMTIARTRLQPGYAYGDDSSEADVEAYFEHEDGDKGRGWVYRGAALGSANVGSAWDWKSRVDDVHVGYGSNYSYTADNDAPEDYWAGFTPPGERAQLPDEDNEDDYWAQYGAGASAPTAGMDVEVDNDADAAPSEPVEPITPPTATIPTPDPAATLSLLLSGLGVDKQQQLDHEREREAAANPTGTSPKDSVLEQKVRAKVRAQLMRAWTAFAADQDAESAGFEWLRTARAIADKPSWGAASTVGGGFDVRSAVVQARIEAAKDMYDVLAPEPEGFFRLCEEAIRQHSPPMQGGDEVPYEYES